ncbi:hypothetical protein VTP01DRAFT_10403 [Rhizomucor pusillus]|uniref:uncharacterized protein n=1 Tax=Rhizomucor pusillus TaxID=4840 RepID=UPI0037436CBB
MINLDHKQSDLVFYEYNVVDIEYEVIAILRRGLLDDNCFSPRPRMLQSLDFQTMQTNIELLLEARHAVVPDA